MDNSPQTNRGGLLNPQHIRRLPRKVLPAILVLVLIYTLLKKELGRHHTPRFAGTREALAAAFHERGATLEHRLRPLLVRLGSPALGGGLRAGDVGGG